MYVQRKDLEDMLVSALRGRLHIVVHGESGTGKSWLYKKVLTDENAEFMVANLANASRFGKISDELRNLVERDGVAIKEGYEEEKKTEIDAIIASGGLSHTDKFAIGQMEPFESCLYRLRQRAGAHPAVLVFDNLEAAFIEPLLKELADMLILCDDDRYTQYRVHLLIVGVTAGIKEYYYKTPHHSTVANRLYELPEVSRLPRPVAATLLRRGLIEQLKYECENFDAISAHIVWVTDSVPQMLHEYGLELARLAEKSNRRITVAMMPDADRMWMYQSLNHLYAVIEHHMNERDAKTGRRNQTLYALGLADGEQFKPQEIEGRLRKAFPVTTRDIVLNIPQMMAQFAKGDRPLIKRSPKGDAYSFVDPRYRMLLRAMLKLKDERVVKLALYR